MNNMSFNLSTKIRRNEKVIFKKVENNVYILDPINATIHTFNNTASFIWSLLDRPKKLVEIIDLVCDEFEIDSQKAVLDITPFIRNYLQQGFLTKDKRSHSAHK